jgi:hypothetical protein
MTSNKKMTNQMQWDGQFNDCLSFPFHNHNPKADHCKHKGHFRME